MVELYFNEICLGELTKHADCFLYNSKEENEAIAKGKYFGMFEYDLYNKQDFGSEELFTIFKKIINDTKRQDIIDQAQVTEDDDEYTRLLKLGQLNFINNGFWVKSHI